MQRGPPVLRPEQEAAVEWMLARERQSPCGGILADDVGFGKTYVVASLISRGGLWPTLVVVPKSVVWQWIRVVRSFHLADRDRACGGTPHGHLVAVTSRAAELGASSADVVIVTPGLLSACSDLCARPWGRVVVDEAHILRNQNTLVHRLMCRLSAQARWAVTATPVQNRRADAVALAKFVGVIVGDDLGILHGLIHNHALDQRQAAAAAAPAPAPAEEGTDEEGDDDEDSGSRAAVTLCEAPTGGSVPALKMRNVVLCSRHGGEDKEWEAAVCESAHAQYFAHVRESVARDLGDEPSGDGEAGGADALFKMELQMRCRMAATHVALYLGALAGKGGRGSLALAREAARARRLGASASSKFEFVVEDVLHAATRRAERCSVVFCEWIDEMEMLGEALRARDVETVTYHGRMTADERDSALQSYRAQCATADARAGGAVVLIAQIRCAACGLNLQCATRVYLMRPQWNPAVEKQAIGRVHRSGQTRVVTAMRLVLEGSLDEVCLRSQKDKLDCATVVTRDDSMRRMLLALAL
jgi:superfamily II DNA or RNA helicase